MSHMIDQLIYEFTKLQRRRLHYKVDRLTDLNISSRQPEGIVDDLIEGEFTTKRGYNLPVYKNYRYKLKKAWLNYTGLAVLDELDRINSLDHAGKQALVEFRGSRTLGNSIEEITKFAQDYVNKYQDLFIFSEVPKLGKRVLMPTLKDVESKITSYAKVHSKKMEWCRANSENFKLSRPRVLEIGFISGGESLIAFERLGCEVYGIDYFYDGQFGKNTRWQLVRDLAKSQVKFAIGDITQKTDFKEDYFDLIYSAQTIEHISDLPSAFREMQRILKPGGLILHAYDPYYHPLGGHSLGILDSPWGHTRLDESEVENYLKLYREYEVGESISWIRSSLNRTHTESYVQRKLVESGFKILRWMRQEIPSVQLNFLTTEILEEAFQVNPTISLSDLLTRSVTFFAQKSK